jgi:hypothetical protein
VGGVAGPLGGRILHYDGVRWTEMASDSQSLYGLWGSAADDVYAVGGIAKSGSILHYDGHAWSPIGPSGYGLLAAWGTGRSDVWLAGYQGRLLHFAGAGWTELAQLTRDSLYALSGSGPQD